MYLPFNFQRRFSSGVFIPIALLAVLAVQHLSHTGRRGRWMPITLLALSLPTNLFLLYAGLAAARAQEPAIYNSRDELAAYAWLDENAATDAIVLAGPRTGNRLPAYADVRVLYGHPSETVHPDVQLAVLEDFFNMDLSTDTDRSAAAEFLEEFQVGYVYWGPDERALGSEGLQLMRGLELAFQQGGYAVYRVSAP
jgi:hypothetical protein